jgi:hypothetical protein
MYFDAPGKENTQKTLEAAYHRAKELNLDEVVVASSKGDTAYQTLDIFNDFKITVVTYHAGFKQPFKLVMEDRVRMDLESKGAQVVAATHALSGLERSLYNKYSGPFPVLIIADTLRLFGQGTKVAVEVSIMAADAGKLSGNDVVAIGGSGRGADSALILKPANQSDLFEMRIREIVCKPSVF